MSADVMLALRVSVFDQGRGDDRLSKLSKLRERQSKVVQVLACSIISYWPYSLVLACSCVAVMVSETLLAR